MQGGAHVPPMTILLLNGNTDEGMTERLLGMARGMAPPGVAFRGATARFGARYIASRAAAAIASHAALDAYAAEGAGAEAVLLACFGDPGLDALREVAPVPVVGLADASAEAACRLGRRFGVVTGGAAWGPMLEEFFAARGLSSRLAGVRTVAATGAEIARDPEGALAVLAGACRESAELDGADVVVLGGAGLAGLAPRLEGRVPVPVLCSVSVGIRAVLAATRPAAPPPASVETTGLSPELKALLA
jgi:Asp/Glu/hydantoin racemase